MRSPDPKSELGVLIPKRGSDSGSWASNPRLRIPDFEFQTSDPTLQIPDFESETLSPRFRTPDSDSQISNLRLRFPDSDSRLRLHTPDRVPETPRFDALLAVNKWVSILRLFKGSNQD